MPSDTAIANLALRVVRGGRRLRADAAANKQPAANKKPATISAKKQLAAVLDAAMSEPVTITRDGKPAAVVLNARCYRQLERLLHKLAESEEDRICAEKMRQAEEEGYLTPAESAAFLREMRDAFGN